MHLSPATFCLVHLSLCLPLWYFLAGTIWSLLCLQDGALNDSELNKFQVKCFNAPLQPTELAGVKEVVGERLSGVSKALHLPAYLTLTQPVSIEA